MAQIVSILNTTVSATTTEEPTTLRYYLDTSRDKSLYGRRESVEQVVGEWLCNLLYNSMF